uniref:NADH dehydrogenase [ubiquinone] 1 beta subcomplex subunit 11, mitochondrial n=1 Tax=Meloidogyne floridensis TaxID=298350 RepID=A0A915P1L9_9BILA
MLLKFKQICDIDVLRLKPIYCRRFASGGGHGHGDDDDVKMEKQPDHYRPGTDTYAYENPWPKLNKGRLDWLFNDGWRRPLPADQGGYMRRSWIWRGHDASDEYKDWIRFHKYMFILGTAITVWLGVVIGLWMKPDWPVGRDWARREAHLELTRRERAGLPLVSPDLIERSCVEASLPSEEELRDFDIII